MREVFEYEFTKLDPVSGAHIDPPSVAVYDTLLRKGASGTPLPGLASAWSTSPDGLRWQVTLRDGTRFHSGRPCDARAVAEALERCRFGDDGCRQVWYWDPVDTIRVLNPRSLEFRLHFPYTRLPTLLWGTHTSIYNDARRRVLGPEYGISEADGTGPFRMLSFRPTRVEAEKISSPNDDGLARVEWISLPDEGDRRTAIEETFADVVRTPPYDLIDELSEHPHWSVAEVPESSQVYLGLNFDRRDLDFHLHEMRAAVEAAVDREALVRAAFAGRGESERSPLPQADPLRASFNSSRAPRMSLEQAKATLEVLGWRLNRDGVRERDASRLVFECIAHDVPSFHRLADELRRQLARLGISLELFYVKPFEPFYEACDRRPASFINKWLWQDPIEAIIGFTRTSCACEGSPNWQSSRLPNLDNAYDAYLRATDGEVWDAAARVQELFMKELPYIPLCAPHEVVAIAKNLQRFALAEGTLYPYYSDAAIT